VKTYIYPDRKQVMVSGVELKPALFLDLDGTVRYSSSGEFINHVDDIELFEGVEETLWHWRIGQGFLILGISNQGGVAFGFKTPRDVEKELDRTVELFDKNPFHLIKACYHHGDGKVEPYNTRSLLRKPDIGMLALCENECFDFGYMIDWSKSLFVGDRPEDQECARNAKIPFRWAWDFFGRPKPATAT
jgi:D-glycero-D-manno-heptose 1,7-bisphosphate phosphatase